MTATEAAVRLAVLRGEHPGVWKPPRRSGGVTLECKDGGLLVGR